MTRRSSLMRHLIEKYELESKQRYYNFQVVERECVDKYSEVQVWDFQRSKPLHRMARTKYGYLMQHSVSNPVTLHQWQFQYKVGEMLHCLKSTKHYIVNVSNGINFHLSKLKRRPN